MHCSAERGGTDCSEGMSPHLRGGCARPTLPPAPRCPGPPTCRAARDDRRRRSSIQRGSSTHADSAVLPSLWLPYVLDRPQRENSPPATSCSEGVARAAHDHPDSNATAAPPPAQPPTGATRNHRQRVCARARLLRRLALAHDAPNRERVVIGVCHADDALVAAPAGRWCGRLLCDEQASHTRTATQRARVQARHPRGAATHAGRKARHARARTSLAGRWVPQPPPRSMMQVRAVLRGHCDAQVPGDKGTARRGRACPPAPPRAVARRPRGRHAKYNPRNEAAVEVAGVPCSPAGPRQIYQQEMLRRMRAAAAARGIETAWDHGKTNNTCAATASGIS